MQPTEARDVGDALDDRPVPAVWPRPTHAGNERCLAGFWIIEASDLDVTLKLAAEGSKACNRKVEGAAQRCESRRPRLWRAQVSSDGFDRIVHNPAYRKVLRKKSGRRCRMGAGVFVAGVRGRPRGAPRTAGDDRRCSTWFL